jgi:ribosomal-protein-alanine N-acetyltransferase
MIERFDKLVGRKVYLRPFKKKDITPEYISWLNDPEVVRHSNQRFITHSESSCQAYLESFENGPNLFLSVRTQLDDLAIGTMTAYIAPQHGTVDIGILIGRKSVWGQGVGQDAWDTLITWFIEKYHIRKVTAGTLSSNKAMIRIMERSGMHCEAIRPKQELLNGAALDLHFYGKYGQVTG